MHWLAIRLQGTHFDLIDLFREDVPHNNEKVADAVAQSVDFIAIGSGTDGLQVIHHFSVNTGTTSRANKLVDCGANSFTLVRRHGRAMNGNFNRIKGLAIGSHGKILLTIIVVSIWNQPKLQIRGIVSEEQFARGLYYITVYIKKQVGQP